MLTANCANFKMLRYVHVLRASVLLLSLAIYGVQVIGEETVGITEDDNETSAKETVREASTSDNWVVNLSWNLLGYATIIIPAAFIIRMLKNSNFNERSGKLFPKVNAYVY